MAGRFAQYQEGLRIAIGFARIRFVCESMQIANHYPRQNTPGVRVRFSSSRSSWRIVANCSSWPAAFGGPREGDGGGTMGAVQARDEKLSLELMEQKAKATKLEQEVKHIRGLSSLSDNENRVDAIRASILHGDLGFTRRMITIE